MKQFFINLKKERESYKEMIDFCCDNMILNNDIVSKASAAGFYFDPYCGSDYDEENDEYVEVYQYFIVSCSDAERLAEYTNELVIYNDELDLYILCVTHYGTPWIGVSANWKADDEFND